MSQRIELGEAFVIVKLQYRVLSSSSLDLKSFVPPPKSPEALPDDFLQSKIPAGAGLHVAGQRKDQPQVTLPHQDQVIPRRPSAIQRQLLALA